MTTGAVITAFFLIGLFLAIRHGESVRKAAAGAGKLAPKLPNVSRVSWRALALIPGAIVIVVGGLGCWWISKSIYQVLTAPSNPQYKELVVGVGKESPHLKVPPKGRLAFSGSGFDVVTVYGNGWRCVSTHTHSCPNKDAVYAFVRNRSKEPVTASYWPVPLQPS